jgi:serine/threonine-protein kinase
MSQRFGLGLACALLLAAPVSAADLFGAIAFSPSTGKVGGGWNFASKDEASSESVTQCGVGDCAAVVVFPSCGAVAVGDGMGMGFSADGSVAKAEETALANCSGYTANCLITMSFCNDGE